MTDRLVREPPGPARDLLEEELIRLTMPVARSVAGRYTRRGVPREDLEQVAYLGLVKAVRRYDPERAGDHFLSFAVPTVRGEVRRYFRDHGWMVRPTRRLQELQPRVIEARTRLHAEDGRTPRPSEIAAHLGEPLDVVVEVLTLDGCYQPTSLDQPVGSDSGEDLPLGALLGSVDDSWGPVEARLVLAAASASLDERDRRVLFLRFFEGRSQREIGEELGITQMQVSRVLARILQRLRREIGPQEGHV